MLTPLFAAWFGTAVNGVQGLVGYAVRSSATMIAKSMEEKTSGSAEVRAAGSSSNLPFLVILLIFIRFVISQMPPGLRTTMNQIHFLVGSTIPGLRLC